MIPAEREKETRLTSVFRARVAADSLSLSRYAKEVDDKSFVSTSNLSTPALNYDSARNLYSEMDYEIMKVSRRLLIVPSHPPRILI